jgi:hypothetical protein
MVWRLMPCFEGRWRMTYNGVAFLGLDARIKKVLGFRPRTDDLLTRGGKRSGWFLPS